MGAVGVHSFDEVEIYVGGPGITNNKDGGGDEIALPGPASEAALDALAVADNLIDEAVLGFSGGGSIPQRAGATFMAGRLPSEGKRPLNSTILRSPSKTTGPRR